MKIDKEHILSKNNKDVFVYTLCNDNALEVKITNYGGIINSIKFPNNKGEVQELVLGFDNVEEYMSEHYLSKNPYLGALIGRYANRIAKGQFKLHDQTYDLVVNNGPNHLHGGAEGFDKKVWASKEFTNENSVGIELEYTAKDMEENYPGELHTKVIYSLNNDNELKIDYQAESDKDTHINLTNHSYFNLSGEETVLNHEVKVNADAITEVDENMTPSGKIISLDGHQLDLREAKVVKENVDQIVIGAGYDHNYILNKDKEGEMSFAGSANSPKSGIALECYTTQPGMQFYTGNFVDGVKDRKGVEMKKRAGFCFETQHFADSPNHSNFPSTLLKKGDKFHETTIYKFSVI